MPKTAKQLGVSRRVYERIYSISDDAFWRALRKGTAPEVKEAVDMGLAGRREEAFSALAERHRTSLSEEWERLRQTLVRQKAPDVAELEDLLNNKIRLWHQLTVDFGCEIDWARSHHGQNMPGFHYLGWLSPATRQVAAEQDRRCAEWLGRTVRSFYRNRLDVVGAGRLERGRGMCMIYAPLNARGKTMMLLPAYLALLNNTEPSADLMEAFMKLFLGFARALELRMTAHARAEQPDTGNHSIAGTCCLFRLAKLFGEFRESRKWEERAEDRLIWFGKNSFFADGGYGERVWGYGHLALSEMAGAIDTARRYGGFPSRGREIERAVRRALRWYAKTLGPRERMPAYGDGAPTPVPAPAMLDLVQKAWPDRTDRYLGVDRTRSYLLRSSEFAIMRNGDEDESVYVNLSFGKYAGWHSHYDQFNLNLWAFDTPVIEEVDRWGPYHNPLDTLVRMPECHNQVLIDGMVYDNRFEGAKGVQWLSTEAVDCFTATHRAYRYFVYAFRGHGCFNIEGVVRRTVVFVKEPGYVLVMDSVADQNKPFNRAISQYWHSPFKFRVLGPTQVRTQGRVGCLLTWARADGLRRLETETVFDGEEVEHDGPLPNRYRLRARRWMPVEAAGMPGFATVLYPFKGKAPEVSVRPLPSDGGEPYFADGFEITTPAGTDRVLLNPEARSGFVCDGIEVPGRGLILLSGGRGEVAWE